MILAPTGTIHGPPPEQEPLPLAAPGEVVTSRPRDWFKGNLQETHGFLQWFLPSNVGVSCKFSHHPIL